MSHQKRRVSNRIAFGQSNPPAPPPDPPGQAEALALLRAGLANYSPTPDPQEETKSADSRPRIEPFSCELTYLASQIPPSVRLKVVERLLRQKYDPSSTDPGVVTALEKAVAQYAKKKANWARCSAERRAKNKAAAIANVAKTEDEAPPEDFEDDA